MREIGLVADDSDFGAILEGRRIHITSLRDAHFSEAAATTESFILNLRHRWWYRDAREAGATIKSPLPYLRNRWRYGDAHEARATTKSTVPNLRN